MSRVSPFLIAVLAASVGTTAVAQEAPQRLQGMAGTWQVQQRMWPAPGAAAVELPPAVARRQLIDGKYLQEIMESSGADAGQPAELREGPVVQSKGAVASCREHEPALLIDRPQHGGWLPAID